MTKLTLGVFGDAGNSFYNASSFYYKPGWYELYNSGGTGPVQAAVAAMVRSWGVSELIQLGDTSYNAQSSSLLDYNIGKHYNDYMQPYGNKPNEFAYADPNSIYSTTTGGIVAEPGKIQWPYNLYNFPYGFANPASGGAGGSSDGLNHFWALQGNHDYGTTIGSYNDYNVNQVGFKNKYIGPPEGPDAYDYQNNINITPPPPNNDDFNKDYVATSKTGSAQQLLDYLPWLQTGDDAAQPGYLKPGQVRIGSNDPRGYDGIYYSVDLGETISGGIRRPLLHVVMLDTPRMMTDAGYYDFNNKDKKVEATDRAAQTGDTSLKAKNYNFDPTDPNQIALFPDPNAAPSDPSASYEMFNWVKQDLAQSNALYKVVTGHHTAYHGGAVPEDANSNNFSMPFMVKFLAGLKDENGDPLLDAYMNGHSHAYSRVLEMEQTSDGIGPGIPILTTGNGGKDQDPLNLVSYGTNVLKPQNWDNTFTFSYTDSNGQVISGTSDNAAINGLDEAYLAAFPQAAAPTSVGSSGAYRYNDNNIPQGFQLSANPDSAKKDPKLVATYQKNITVAPENQNPLSKTKEFTVTIPQYNSMLTGAAGANSSVSGLYGYGSGAAFVEVDDGYLFMNYRTVVPLDPAITLIGKQLGLSAQQMQRGSLFFEQWSPTNAKVDNLALFSFDVIIDSAHPDGYLDHLQLVQSGNGYLEQSISSSVYQDSTYTFEIQGNNPTTPLPSDQSDPSRAAVELTFNAGQLKAVRFAKDGDGNERKGTGYKELSNSNNGNNFNQSSTKSMLVGINVNLEAQYTFADQAAHGSDLYQDWYLMADTAIHSRASQQGPFGALSLELRPSAQRAREIIASQPLTTGYSGSGEQAAYATPQQGTVTITDALGTIVGGGTSQGFNNGNVSLNLSRLAAPGSLQLEFDGDPYSSYQVNYRAAATKLAIDYLPWESGISAGPEQSLSFSTDVTLNVSRSDSQSGAISFGLRSATDPSAFWLLQSGDAASASALNVNRLFTPSGADSWLASEGQRQGSTSTQFTFAAGTWLPVATDSNGQYLALQSVSVAGNAVQVDFEGGYQARYSTPSTGAATATPENPSLVMTVQRLGCYANGLALYEADPVTGAIIAAGGERLLPGDSEYLQSALENATKAGLYFSPEQLPEYQAEKVFQSLPLMTNSNYGLLLVRQNNRDDLASSFSQANAGGQVIVQSFAAPGRGVCFGLEDLKPDGTDYDFNDLNVTLSSSQFSLG